MIRRALTRTPSPKKGERAQELQKNWGNILFLSLAPVIGVLGTTAYAIAFGVRWWEPTFLFVLFGLVSLSVTAGYHGCFAHKAHLSQSSSFISKGRS